MSKKNEKNHENKDEVKNDIKEPKENNDEISSTTIEKMLEEIKQMEEAEKKAETTAEPKTEKTELELAKYQIASLTDSLKRLQADFDNYRKRVEIDKIVAKKYSNAEIITKLLPIIDTFEIAIKNSEDLQKYKEGTDLIYVELMSLLKNEGLQKIEAKGKPLDPAYHDAMMAVEVKGVKPDQIIDVLQEGYKLKDRIIRHSKVKISK